MQIAGNQRIAGSREASVARRDNPGFDSRSGHESVAAQADQLPERDTGRSRPGEFRARALLAAARLAALAVLGLMGCWSDGAAIQSCKQACLPFPVAKMSSDGCVCFTGCPDWAGRATPDAGAGR